MKHTWIPAVAAMICSSCVSVRGERAAAQDAPLVTVGSKKFTESVILGELAAHLARQAGAEANHLAELGGTQVVFKALARGDIDVYPEYLGTISKEILAGSRSTSEAGMARLLLRQGIRISRSLGFNNKYEIGMRRQTAERLGIRTLSDLARHPELKLGFSHEFLDRADGWPGLRRHYNLPHRAGQVMGLDHDLAYRGLERDDIQATDLYSTDAEIRYYDLAVLDDDRGYFPDYSAVWLYRSDLAERAPEVVEALRRVEGEISEADMQAMNSQVQLEGVSESQVAADFVNRRFGLEATPDDETLAVRLARRAAEHLWLVSASLAAAIVVAVPLGIWAAANRHVARLVLAATGLLQTIPSLALLVFMIPLLGLGPWPAIAALFLYSLLPIVRNTYTGLRDIAPPIRESAEALGLPRAARLRLVELPLALPAVLAGIKTSAVINVGTATLGAFVGAGGFGLPIFKGIRLDDQRLYLLEGALPAAVLALAVQGFFDLAERLLVPRGLRLGRDERKA